MSFRSLVLASLMIGSVFVLAPSVVADDCLVTARGVCVRDVTSDPCEQWVSCDVCVRTADVCVHVENCLEGRPGCIDPGACTCDPQPTPMGGPGVPRPPHVDCLQVMPWSKLCSGDVQGFVQWWLDRAGVDPREILA